MSTKFNIAPKIGFNIHDASRYAFEHFTHRNANMIEEMGAFLRFSKDKSVLLDIGAHYGIFSLAFCAGNSFKKAYAVEPSPHPFSVLNENIKTNPSFDIESYPLALGSTDGTIKMYYQWDHLVPLPKGKKENKSVKVVSFKLDSFLKQFKLNPDLIKIDVEGCEYNVLKGGKVFLKKRKPLIILETHTKLLSDIGISTDMFIKLIYSLGYKIYDLDGIIINNPKIIFRAIPNNHIILSHQPL